MNDALNKTAQEIVLKTILAADESTKTIAKRLASVGVESNPENNRLYRQFLLSAAGIGNYVSGVILYDETIRQSDDNKIAFSKLLSDQGIVPGIKVDEGTEKFSGDKVDTFTKGLDGLPQRLEEYFEMGARFAKWRSVYTITDGSPTDESVKKNAEGLARYAKDCQSAGIVPIVEPEVLMDGDHSLEQDRKITTKVLTSVFEELEKNQVDLEGIILKPNMITSGKDNSQQADVKTVAQETLNVLKTTVPTKVPGIAFLSGGQSPDLATQHLNAINRIKNGSPQEYPWRITASFGRALQGEALDSWAGKKENIEKAQRVFIERAEKVYKASLGQL